MLIPTHWPSCSVLKLLSIVRKLQIRNIMLLQKLVYFRLTVGICLEFLFKFDVSMIRKQTTLLFFVYNEFCKKRVKSIVLDMSIIVYHKSGLGILSFGRLKIMEEENNKDGLQIEVKARTDITLSIFGSGRIPPSSVLPQFFLFTSNCRLH